LTIPLSKSDLNSLKKKVQVESVKVLNGYPFLVISKPITLDGDTIGILSGALLMKSHYDFLNTVRNLLFLMSIVVVVGAATTGWYMAKKALKPIDNITDMANQIQKADDLKNRVQYEGPKDELGRLTHTINNMLGRIERAYDEQSVLLETQRRFVSDASHELRTPLTSIRGNVSLLKKMINPTPDNELTLESIVDIDAESERMSRLVSDLLSLARADGGLLMDKQPLAIKEVLEAAVKRASFLPKSANWEPSDFSGFRDVYVNGNDDYLLQMIMVFVENAFKYTLSGSVQMNAIVEADRIGILIEDTGLGIAERDVPFLFDRFFRADESRGQTSGTGLGLSIAKWIVDEHEGEVVVRTALGKGTQFTIWLPTCEKV
jgi:signal transduction histidine kinase